jgi:hypothetical protein
MFASVSIAILIAYLIAVDKPIRIGILWLSNWRVAMTRRVESLRCAGRASKGEEKERPPSRAEN